MQASSSTTLLSSAGNSVRLESGTRLLLRVESITPAPPPASDPR
jgi:hypothetical protein